MKYLRKGANLPPERVHFEFGPRYLITYKTHLEKAEYLGSKEIETKFNLVISTLYDAEIEIKKKAFAGQSRTATQPELLEAMASASKEALHSALSH